MDEKFKKFIEDIDTIVARKFGYTVGYISDAKLETTVYSMLCELYDSLGEHGKGDSIHLTFILEYMPENK